MKDERAEELMRFFPGLTVRAGLFHGLKYPGVFLHGGSAFFPKLVGAYEDELRVLLGKWMRSRHYDLVINIGCGEGYYAVGLPTKISAHVLAFERDARSRDFCRLMARINDVGARVTVEGECKTKNLENIHCTDGLVICDCEGEEEKLFTLSTVDHLKNCDFVIELYDFKKPGIGKSLRKLFNVGLGKTHRIFTVNARKRRLKDFAPLIPRVDPETLRELLDEERPVPVQWLVVERKHV